MKRITALIFVLFTLFSFVGCDSGSGDSSECIHDWQHATFDNPATCSKCNMTHGDKLTPAPNWGFNYLSEMGYRLIDVTSYNWSDPYNSYIIATGDSILFENGYMLSQDFVVENGKCIFGSTANPQKYSIINNDNLDINNGYKSFHIDQRKTIEGRNNFVCFVKNGGLFEFEQWLVPYSLIDWERGAEVVSSTDYEQEIKLYLIS